MTSTTNEPQFAVTRPTFDPRLTWAWAYYTAAALLALAAQPWLSSAAWGVAFNVPERVLGLVALVAWLALVLRGRWASSDRILRITTFAAAILGVVLLVTVVGQFLAGMVRPGVPMLLISAVLLPLGHKSLANRQYPEASPRRVRAAALGAGLGVVGFGLSAVLGSFTLTHGTADALHLDGPSLVTKKGWQLNLGQSRDVLPGANGVVVVRTDGLTAVGADGTTLWEYRRTNATVEQWAASYDRETTAFIWKVGRHQLVVVDNLTGRVLFERTLHVEADASPKLLLSSTVVAVVTPTAADGYRVRTGEQVWTHNPRTGCTLEPAQSASALGAVLVVESCAEVDSSTAAALYIRDDSPTRRGAAPMDPDTPVQVSDDGRLVATTDPLGPENTQLRVFDTATMSNTRAEFHQRPASPERADVDPPATYHTMVTPDGKNLGRAIDDPRCRPGTFMTQIVTEGAVGCVADDGSDSVGTVVVVEYNRGLTELTFEKVQNSGDPKLFVTGGAWVVVQHRQTTSGGDVSITGLVR